MRRYNPKDIEPKWQKIWDESQVYTADLSSEKPKYIAMSMFNYPSGHGIHIGHAMNFTISDVMARFKRQQGYESYHPVGWDAFGLPAENYAIKTGVSPQASMASIIPGYHTQYKAMGWSNDWSKEISTHVPAYYKWTQWIFSEMYKTGMAYQDARLQWWCTKCQTVLANEQVIDGKCWRHDTADDSEVKKKEVKQWFFKVTEYANEMLDATHELDWSEVVKTSQINWIGKSQGAEVVFTIAKNPDSAEAKDSLKFTPELTQLIINGEKSSTVRLEPKNLEVGDVADFITRLSPELISGPFARARITQVRSMPLSEIPLDVTAHTKSKEEQITSYRQYYGQNVSNETEFTIYDFELLPSFIKVFTTRPDTLYGATFLVLAPEHELVKSIVTDERRHEVETYVTESGRKNEVERQENKEKTGVFTGSYAINPVNGEKIPIWIADYVLTGYGTGAIMAVPAHDERDNEFAKKFGLPITRVVQNNAADSECSHDEGVLINSGVYSGIASADAREKIVEDLVSKGLAETKTNFRIRDWSVSRQRYWGAPIPIINCPTHGTVLDENLPVLLPELEDFQPSGDGRSALARATEWLHVPCPVCGEPSQRETDTLDTYICSSWYFLRYLNPTNEESAFDSEMTNKWMPIDFYNGGDHATAHMIYARFMTRFFWHQGLLAEPEPFKRFLFNGKVTAADGTMFSKSKGNGVDPLEIISQGYGADALRTYLMFAAPLDFWMRWDPQGVPGTYRFLNRIWNIVQEFSEIKSSSMNDDKTVLRVIHTTIKKVTADLEGQKYNTAIAAMMKCVNDLYDLKAKSGFGVHWQFALNSLVAMVAPFAPHVADELWHDLGNQTTIQKDSWPIFDTKYLENDTVTIVIQVNGKLRATVLIPSDCDEKTLTEIARNDEKVAGYLSQGEVVKTIYVPSKLINFVVK